MTGSWLHSPLYHLLLGALCGAVAFRIGWRTGNRFVLPALQGALGFVAFAAIWRAAGPVAGAVAVAGWALGGSLVSLPAFIAQPDAADRRVLRAASYRREMFDWLRTGVGPESRPLATAGRHLLELAIYLAAAALTANLLALVMGAILLNYMNAYVARLLRAAKRPWTVRLLAWNVWSLVRLAAYVALGAAAAAPLAERAGFPARSAEIRALLIAGGAGVVLDLVLKLALSRRCGRRLAAAVDLDV